MRILIVEDDFGSRRFLQALFQGRPSVFVDVVVDGDEAVQAFRLAWEEKTPYELILLDIMMPNMDGHEALREIRKFEESIGVHHKDRVSVIMTTALGDPRNVVDAYYKGEADAYLVKPIEQQKLFTTMAQLGFEL
ncbi:two-component system response regulator [Alkalispirochaeta sphaeroplastigenens]|uniref:Two-component system response regulator n=1 Tax=Alkalispirochaeta sphaeroplastigenens TaxID=1187066 RepID=A0A2S4K1P1_9SPIO|nr:MULTISPECIES: response regulator [Alkalispirochaeta]POR05682.1 two-component system response regulator [Alkalispirochaeta sphaeroplastigenens]